MTTKTSLASIIRGKHQYHLPAMDDRSVHFVFCDPPYNAKIKYDTYKDNLPFEQYRDEMNTLITSCRRVSRRGIAFFVPSKLRQLYSELMPTAHLIVVYKRAAGVVKNNFAQQYYCLFVEGKPLIRCRDVWDDIRLPGEGYYFTEKRYDNPGMTSLELTKRVIKTFTNEGETILDPCCGSGTTLEAALRLNRNAIGIELSAYQCRIATERVEQIRTLF